jgi:asparagine synthase (glutamine-hydrolysing)
MFSFFSTSKQSLSNISLQPSWCVKWNSLISENNISVIDTKPSFNEQKNLMLIGDVWLTNQLNLLENLGINPQNWQQNDQHLIIYLWQKYGVKCVNKLQGMFAFVICNLETNQLWLVRDRTGSYTLYYTKDVNNNYAIAPRLKTLSNYHARELDLIALRDYLATAFVPGERTLWQNVSKLSSGTILSLPEQTFTRYYQPIVNVQNADKSLQLHSERLRLLLEQIIQEYLPQNEAVGVYLSGGLDSSCVTALAAKFHKYPIHTYSIHFGENCPNELMYSSLVATHCQTKHNILEITPQQMWNNLPITMANLDNPIGDPLTVPNYMLAQLAQKDVKIILNGEGSDPCFGGPKNQPMLLNQLYQSNENLVKAYLTSFQKCFVDLPNLLNYDTWQIVKNEPSIFATNLDFSTEYLNYTN